MRLMINPELLSKEIWITPEKPGEKFRVFWSTRWTGCVTAQYVGGEHDGKYTSLNPSKLRREGYELRLVNL